MQPTEITLDHLTLLDELAEYADRSVAPPAADEHEAEAQIIALAEAAADAIARGDATGGCVDLHVWREAAAAYESLAADLRTAAPTWDSSGAKTLRRLAAQKYEARADSLEA